MFELFEKEMKELMAKHQELLFKASQEIDPFFSVAQLRQFPNRPQMPGYDALVEAIAKELSPELTALGKSVEQVTRAADILAEDMVSRYRIPDGGGALIEGTIASDGGDGAESDNPDIMEGADAPAPEPITVEARGRMVSVGKK